MDDPQNEESGEEEMETEEDEITPCPKIELRKKMPTPSHGIPYRITGVYEGVIWLTINGMNSAKYT